MGNLSEHRAALSWIINIILLGNFHSLFQLINFIYCLNLIVFTLFVNSCHIQKYDILVNNCLSKLETDRHFVRMPYI